MHATSFQDPACPARSAVQSRRDGRTPSVNDSWPASRVRIPGSGIRWLALLIQRLTEPLYAQMSCFTTIKLDERRRLGDTSDMNSKGNTSTRQTPTTAETIRSRIETGGERVWRFADFEGLPPAAVAKTLSRMSQQGILQRLGKGLYYRSRQTAFGQSQPNRSQIRSLPLRRKGVFPSGVSAANLLGFTTQNPGRVELATDGPSLPRLIVGKETIIHTRRPQTWRSLSQEDAAFLDFLRNRGAASELAARETVSKLVTLAWEQGRLTRLLKIAESEPPRVRAMLGAIAEQLGFSESLLNKLRESLNPLSRFDFGILGALEYAGKWQAKECKRP